MRIALYQPDIPQNTGSILRLAACMAVPVDIIEPCGFAWDDQKLKRAGMDYLDQVQITRHPSWEAFIEAHEFHDGPAEKIDDARPRDYRPRLILLSTKASNSYTNFAFHNTDILLFGRESAGVPEAVQEEADFRLTIPMAHGTRSLNVAQAAAMVLGEALRQVRG